MKKVNLSFLVFAVILGLAVVAVSGDNGKRRRFEADLKGIYEVGTGIGAVSTVASGSFRATLSEDGQRISYRLRYSDLEGDITQAHIHIGQFHTAGGISVWLCKTDALPGPTPDLTPLCPGARSGVVEGTLTEANVVGPLGQGLDPLEASRFAELVRLIRSGVTYANVHSVKFPGGEVRGQIRQD
jgi:hypothetical protein